MLWERGSWDRRGPTPVFSYVRKDGRFLPVAIAVAPIIHDGEPHGAVVAFHDSSERLRQQEALRENEERLRVLWNSSMDAVLVHPVDPTGRTPLLEVNDVACERLGYSRAELLTMGPADINAPDSADGFPRRPNS